MRKSTAAALWLITAALLTLPSVLTAEGLTKAKFDELRNTLIPPEGESWTTIPWNLDLLDAQAKAGEKRKPLFIWAMNGHPMACV